MALHPPILDQNRLAENLTTLVSEFKRDVSSLHEQILNQSYELQTINEIGQLLISTLDDQEIIRQLMHRLIDLFDVQRASFWLADYENNQVQFQFALNQAGVEDEISEVLRHRSMPSIGEGIVGRVVSEGLPIIDNDLQSNPYYLSVIDEKSRLPLNYNTLSVPVIQEGEIVGVIQLFNRVNKDNFDLNHQNLLLAVTPWVSVALKNANLYKRIQIINDIGQRLISTLDYREMLRHLMSQLIRDFRVERASFWLVDPDKKQVMFQFSLNQEGIKDEISDVLAKLPAVNIGDGFVGMAAKLGKPIIENNPEFNPQHLSSIDERSNLPKTRNVLTAPLNSEGKTIGVIQILNRRHNELFNAEDRELLMAITPWVASALSNAQKYEKAINDVQTEHEKRLTEQVNSRTAEVLRSITHHLKNRLGSARFDLTRIDKIIANDDHLQTQTLSELTSRVSKVSNNVRRSAELTQSLLQPYQPGSKIPTKLYELVNSTIQELDTPSFVTIKNGVSQDLPMLEIEVKNTRDYFHEILTNAVKASRTMHKKNEAFKGEITISSSWFGEEYIVILFANNGLPIPKTRWEIIFDQFETSRDLEEDSDSFGLGLWGARTFFRRVGGDLYVEKSDLTETVFAVKLPVE